MPEAAYWEREDDRSNRYAEANIAWQDRVAVLERILKEREWELLGLKGPCSNKACRLHYAHSGPCDPKRTADVEA